MLKPSLVVLIRYLFSARDHISLRKSPQLFGSSVEQVLHEDWKVIKQTQKYPIVRILGKEFPIMTILEKWKSSPHFAKVSYLQKQQQR
jgi:hypothetical protein